MKYQKDSIKTSTPKIAIFSHKVAELAENNGKSNILQVVYHQKLIGPSFQPDSALFHCTMKYQKDSTQVSTPKTAIFSKTLAEMAENERKFNITTMVHYQKLTNPSL